jgi:metal-responsive CopG/Arc/MetJ family transcriptional regulator
MSRVYEQNKGKGKSKTPMKNITINIPNCYDENIQYLIRHKIVASRSEAIRVALKEFINNEYGTNLELIGFEGINDKTK